MARRCVNDPCALSVNGTSNNPPVRRGAAVSGSSEAMGAENRRESDWSVLTSAAVASESEVSCEICKVLVGPFLLGSKKLRLGGQSIVCCSFLRENLDAGSQGRHPGFVTPGGNKDRKHDYSDREYPKGRLGSDFHRLGVPT